MNIQSKINFHLRNSFESLFTNIPLEKTIDLCVDLLFNDMSNIDSFTKTDFHELSLLLLATITIITMPESLVLFNSKYYKQKMEYHGLPIRTNFWQYFPQLSRTNLAQKLSL